jgi:tetratricopeptide (TPR) repeat protein
LDYQQQSLDMRKQIFGESYHPNIAASHHNLGTTCRKLGRIYEAITHYQVSLKIQRSVYKDGLHPEAGVTLLNLANAYCSIGRTDEAISCYEESLRIQTAVYQSDDHPNVILVLSNLGLVLASCGEFCRAIRTINRASMQFKVKEQGLPQLLKNSISTIIRSFAIYYGLDFPTTSWRISNCLYSDLDFTDSSTHLTFVGPESTNESLIESYKLAAIFLPEENAEMKKTVFDKLFDLTGVSHDDIEVWLRKDSGFSLEKGTRLTSAIARGDLQLVSTLIRLNSNVNEPNNDSEKASPLYCALGFFAQPVNLDIVKLLLDNGADANQAMSDGDTPLHMAHYTGNRKVIHMLLSHGGDINGQNDQGKTPLHVLIETKEVGLKVKQQLWEEFREHYDENLVEGNGKTARDYASENCPELLSVFQQ